MDKKTKSYLGWSEIILAILVALNQGLTWPGWLQYLWAGLIAIVGIWALATKK